MKGLMTKDFRLFLHQKRFFMVIMFIALIFAFSSDSSFVIFYMTFIGGVFVMSTISYDEFNNGMPFLMTLPITRKTYAREKYVFGIASGLIMWGIGVASALVGWLISRSKGGMTDINEIIVQAAVSIPVLIIIISVMIPIQLKFGSEKGRMVWFIAAAVIILAGFGMEAIADMTGIDMSGIAEALSKISGNVILIILAVTTVIVLLISIAISSIIMEKKEF